MGVSFLSWPGTVDRVTVAPQDETGLLDLDSLLGTPAAGQRLVYLLRARAACWAAVEEPLPRLAAPVTARGAVSAPGPLTAPGPGPRAFEVELAASELTLTIPRPDRSILDVVEESGVGGPVIPARRAPAGPARTAVLGGLPDHRELGADRGGTPGRGLHDDLRVPRSCTDRLVLKLVGHPFINRAFGRFTRHVPGVQGKGPRFVMVSHKPERMEAEIGHQRARTRDFPGGRYCRQPGWRPWPSPLGRAACRGAGPAGRTWAGASRAGAGARSVRRPTAAVTGPRSPGATPGGRLASPVAARPGVVGVRASGAGRRAHLHRSADRGEGVDAPRPAARPASGQPITSTRFSTMVPGACQRHVPHPGREVGPAASGSPASATRQSRLRSVGGLGPVDGERRLHRSGGGAPSTRCSTLFQRRTCATPNVSDAPVAAIHPRRRCPHSTCRTTGVLITSIGPRATRRRSTPRSPTTEPAPWSAYRDLQTPLTGSPRSISCRTSRAERRRSRLPTTAARTWGPPSTRKRDQFVMRKSPRQGPPPRSARRNGGYQLGARWPRLTGAFAVRDTAARPREVLALTDLVVWAGRAERRCKRARSPPRSVPARRYPACGPLYARAPPTRGGAKCLSCHSYSRPAE